MVITIINMKQKQERLRKIKYYLYEEAIISNPSL
jgi:hypothetical protein